MSNVCIIHTRARAHTHIENEKECVISSKDSNLLDLDFKHPKTPILFMQKIVDEKTEFDFTHVRA